MSAVLTRGEIHVALKEIVAECLGCDSDEVTLEANFFHDLGGESIDVIDLTFRCEKQLGLRVGFQQLQDTTLWQFDSTGRLSDESLARIKSLFPLLDLSDLERHTGPFHPHDFMTINRIVQLIDQAQAAVASKPVDSTDAVLSPSA